MLGTLRDAVFSKLPRSIFSLSLLCLSLSLGLIYITPEGPNKAYLSNIRQLALLTLIISGSLTYSDFRKHGRNNLFKKIELPKFSDSIYLLIPLTPIINYIVLNRELLLIIDTVYVLALTIFAVLLLGALSILISITGSFRVLMIFSLVFLFTIFNTSTILANKGEGIGSLTIIQSFYIVSMSTLLIVFDRINKRYSYILAIAFFLLTTLSQTYSQYTKNASEKNVQVMQRNIKTDLKNNIITETPNMYILVYESYGNEETIGYYGFDNSKQMNYLVNVGFKVVHGCYSIGSASLDSMTKVLDISNVSSNLPSYTSGNATGLNYLKELGYKTVAVFSSLYFFTGQPINSLRWDLYYPDRTRTGWAGVVLFNSILEGIFRHNAFENYLGNYEEYVSTKRQHLTNLKNFSPALFYTHNSHPGHTQNSGVCLPEEKDKFFDNLRRANDEMQGDLNTILRNDPNSIIFVVGDHGPYLTKNCFNLSAEIRDSIDKIDIQDRNGTLMAVYWPENINHRSDFELMIIQDIFPSILAFLANDLSLFDKLKMPRVSNSGATGGVYIDNGVLVGGVNDGEPLFNRRSYKLNNPAVELQN